MNRPNSSSWRMLATLPLLLAGCGEAPPPVAAALPVLVTTVAGQGQSSATTRVLPGFVSARYQSDLGFQVAGRISARLVETGARVRKGQVLLRLQPADYAEGALAADDQLQAARAEARQSASDAQRFASLVKTGAVSEADNERQQVRAQAAQARLNQLTRQRAVARNRLAYTTLTAPFDGVVTTLRAEVGQVVNEGQPLVVVAREDALEVVVDVPEDLASQVPTGVLSGRLTGTGDQSVSLRLRELAPAATLPLRSYRASFSVIAPARQTLRLGMSAEVSLPVPHGTGDAGVVDLPAGAIMSRGRAPSVWVVTPPATLARQAVTVTRLTDAGVQVTGLRAGQQVVITGTEKLRAGLRVRAIVRTATAFEPAPLKGAQP